MKHRNSEELTRAPDGRPLAEQPRWRQDFPIDVPQDQYVARREFTKFLALTSFAFAFGQVSILASSLGAGKKRFPELEIARLADLPIGGSRQFDYPGKGHPRLLVRLGAEQFVAFDARCTHLSCPVIPQVERSRFHCPCHDGNFDLTTGRPLSGPPRRPLPQVRLELRGDRIFAIGVTERTT